MKASYSTVIDLLLDQNVVAIFQGKSEIGPRALGNRSLLFDPRNPNGKDIVNKIKKREPFRPFAGSILLEHVSEWFDMYSLDESPYMTFAVDAKQKAKDEVPSIIHVDGTCRIQTVKQSNNYHYWNLINTFYQRTSVPILFNTSFNLAGEVMVQTIDDALDTMRRSDVNYLYLPEYEEIIKYV